MSVEQVPGGTYTYGDCTYGMALMYPGLPNTLGNAKDWVPNAASNNLTVLSRPTPGTIVGYGGGHGYSEFGHVASVLQLDPNNSNRFLVREMNYNGWNTWDTRWSDMSDVLGFIVPPGVQVQPNADNPTCVTFSWSLFGSTICFDTIVGGAMVITGALVLVAGAIILGIALLQTPVGRETNKATSQLKLPKKRQRPGTPSPAERQAASERRVAVARQRARQPRTVEEVA